VSSYQGLIDFDVAEEKMAFVYIRAGSGYLSGDMQDPQLERNAAGFKDLMPRGFYFVIRCDQNINRQMDNFLDIIGKDPGELPPALDVETNDGNLSPSEFARRLNQAIHRLEISPILNGKKAAIYSRAGFWNQNVARGKIDYTGRTLWVANYHSDPQQVLPAPLLPADWPYWTLWQLSADGNGLGKEYGAKSYSIDINAYNGSAASFETWFGVKPNDTTAGGDDDPVNNPPDYVIPTTSINIRSGPAVTYPKIGTTLKGSRWSVMAVVRESDGLWVKVADEVYIAYWLCEPVYR
jgi:GH25 family lysozyme M1 (1,4-beta-N-acetylmuramidase)